MLPSALQRPAWRAARPNHPESRPVRGKAHRLPDRHRPCHRGTPSMSIRTSNRFRPHPRKSSGTPQNPHEPSFSAWKCTIHPQNRPGRSANRLIIPRVQPKRAGVRPERAERQAKRAERPTNTPRSRPGAPRIQCRSAGCQVSGPRVRPDAPRVRRERATERIASRFRPPPPSPPRRRRRRRRLGSRIAACRLTRSTIRRRERRAAVAVPHVGLTLR
jgi:hypothetical protein